MDSFFGFLLSRSEARRASLVPIKITYGLSSLDLNHDANSPDRLKFS
jgi:hypothetical protein